LNSPQYFEGHCFGKVMAEETLFEKILSGTIPGNFVARGPNWGSFLDVFPRREGHTLVVPTRPASRLADLTDEELAGLMSGVKTTQKKLSAYFNTEDFTIIVHDGPLAGQEIPHVHIHVLPRQEGDNGKSLLALWPDSPMPSGTPDFAALAELCESIREE
jgi:histidine triad (HIT) family protein